MQIMNTTTDTTQHKTIGAEALRLSKLKDSSEKGRQFEKLLEYVAPRILELEVEQCWRWKNLPQSIRSEVFAGTTKQDIGIDLVARLLDGSYVAIQAKCISPDRKLNANDLTTAIGATVWRRNVSHCWLITTGGWTRAVEQQLGEGWSILHAPSKWTDIPLKSEQKQAVTELDALQTAAFNDVLENYRKGFARGRLVMACGTGKTLVSQRVAEAITPNNGIVLYATPSIALTGQSRQAWLREAKREIRTVVVCSQADAGETTSGYVAEIEAPATTDSETIVKLVKRAQNSLGKKKHGGMTVIFTTYQSMLKIVQAQKLKKGLPTIDFAIADEAHRTAGVIKNKESKAFQAIHHYLTARRRLYQTATPRIYSLRSVKKLIDGLEQQDVISTRIIDMRNDTDFGPEFHRLTFREALSAPESERRLVDYEIIVVTIDSNYLVEEKYVGEKAISNTSMYQRMAAVSLALYGVARTIENERLEEPIHSCIGFCNTRKSAKEVARVMGDEQLRNWAAERLAGWDANDVLPIQSLSSGYIDGNTRAPQRFEELSILEGTRNSDKAHITMNVKVLTEGVDVPALDAVSFMEPRDSEIDIVQAVGRVMRKPKHGDKSKGYIIIPVIMDMQQLLFDDVDETLSRWNQDWRVLGQVLRALKSHDPDIETDLEKRIKIHIGTRRKGDGNGVPARKFWQMLQDGVFNQLMPTIQSKLQEETENELQTSLIKQAIIIGARAMQKETGLAKKLAKTVGVADSTNQPEKRACLQASLILTNSLLMHQRLIEQGALEGRNLTDLSDVHRSVEPEAPLLQSWRRVLLYDYEAIFQPGLSVLEQSKIGSSTPEGMRSALRTLSEHCKSIAKIYAELGMDQAGELFQAAMDEADAEGAYYTLSPAAMLLAELACDARAPENDSLWRDPNTWTQEAILDPACGSGTLLTAMATAIRRRRGKAFDPEAEKTLVEHGLTGLDRNTHALQIAGTQIAIQSVAPSLRKLGLYTMQWGRYGSGLKTNSGAVKLGSLELLNTDRSGYYNYGLLKGIRDENIKGEQLVLKATSQETDLYERLSRTVIGITNPPYTKGAKVDKNVHADVRKAIQSKRKDLAKQVMMRRSDVGDMLKSDSLRPWFSVLLEEVLDKEKGVIAKVMPTTACLATDPSERIFWAKHFDILYIITLHSAKQLNWSVDTDITESLMIGKRRLQTKSSRDTQFINLKKRPNSGEEVFALREAIVSGTVNKEWGRVTYCSAERMRKGDWTAAVWYDPELAKASWYLEDLAESEMWERLGQFGRIYTTKQTVGQEKWEMLENPDEAEIPVAKSSSGKTGYNCMKGEADAWARRTQKYRDNQRELENLKNKTGHLLVTNTQDSGSARLTAFVSEEALAGYTWTPINCVNLVEAKALAVWLNSTPGRIAMRSVLSRKLTWPMWQPAALMKVTIPNIFGEKGSKPIEILFEGFEKLKLIELEKYRDGYTTVRQNIDEIVSRAMNIPMEQLIDWGKKLAEEPTIRGNEICGEN